MQHVICLHTLVPRPKLTTHVCSILAFAVLVRALLQSLFLPLLTPVGQRSWTAQLSRLCRCLPLQPLVQNIAAETFRCAQIIKLGFGVLMVRGTVYQIVPRVLLVPAAHSQTAKTMRPSPKVSIVLIFVHSITAILAMQLSASSICAPIPVMVVYTWRRRPALESVSLATVASSLVHIPCLAVVPMSVIHPRHLCACVPRVRPIATSGVHLIQTTFFPAAPICAVIHVFRPRNLVVWIASLGKCLAHGLVLVALKLHLRPYALCALAQSPTHLLFRPELQPFCRIRQQILLRPLQPFPCQLLSLVVLLSKSSVLRILVSTIRSAQTRSAKFVSLGRKVPELSCVARHIVRLVS